MPIFIYILSAIIIYYLFFKKQESYTDIENTLVNDLVNYIKTSNTTFSGYSDILTTRKNTSMNLGKYETYVILSDRGTDITPNDIFKRL